MIQEENIYIDYIIPYTKTHETSRSLFSEKRAKQIPPRTAPQIRYLDSSWRTYRAGRKSLQGSEARNQRRVWPQNQNQRRQRGPWNGTYQSFSSPTLCLSYQLREQKIWSSKKDGIYLWSAGRRRLFSESWY